MEPTDRAYVSILSWPEGWGHARRVEALVRAGALDPYDAGMMARRATPAIVQVCDALVRGDILSELHRLGVMAVAPSRSELEAYPRVETPARVTRFSGSPPRGFSVHTRDGGAWTFRSGDVHLIVFGRVRLTEQISRQANTETPYRARRWTHGSRDCFVSFQRPGDFESGGWGHTARIKRAVETVDLYLSAGGGMRRIRLKGSSAHVRPLTDAHERPCLLAGRTGAEDWAAMLPGVRIDLGFDAFNTPPDVELRASQQGHSATRLNPVAFDFYSVWVAMLDRAVRGW